MPFLYTILGIILFFIIIFSIPVRVTAHYDGTFTLFVKYSLLKINLLPKKEKKKKDKPKKAKKDKPKKDKPKKEKAEKEKPEEHKVGKKKKKEDKDNIFLKFYKNQGFEGVLQLIADALEAVTGIFSDIFKHFVFRELYLDMTIAGSDAAETAIKYGKISSAVFPAMGLLCSKARVKKYDIDISPDFLATKDDAKFHVQFGISPIFITNAVIIAGYKLVKNVLLKLLKANNEDNKQKKTINKKVKKVLKER